MLENDPKLKRANEPKGLGAHEVQSLYSHLLSLGQYWPLDIKFDVARITERLAAFENDWKVYNPGKPGFNRFGLSLTSLDGGLSGMPDLTSLYEYNRAYGTNYYEDSFRKFTKVYDAIPELHPLIEPIKPQVCRSHFLKFNSGGFFPYHRDDFFFGARFLRIFVPFYPRSARDFVFLLENERIHLENGRAYFMNTRLEHAVFSFDGPSPHLVVTAEISHEVVNFLTAHVHSG
jgi:hypothetical protein